MRVITIMDRNADKTSLSFDLIHVLRTIGSEVFESSWSCRDVEAVGPTAEELHELSERAATVPGPELIRIATALTQTIDGIFEGYRVGVKAPWLRIRAVDGSAFDVECDEPKVFDQIRTAFENVRDIPR